MTYKNLKQMEVNQIKNEQYNYYLDCLIGNN